MTPKRREFLCTEDRKTLHYIVFGDRTEVKATAGDPGEVRFPPITLSGDKLDFALRLLEEPVQPNPTPHLNLDLRRLSDEDAVDLVACDAYFHGMVETLTGLVRTLNLERESHRDLCEACVTLTRECIKLGRASAELEQRIRRITDAVAVVDVDACCEEEPVFFETSWSEGPFSLADMEAIVSRDAAAGHRYHTDGGLTYAEYRSRQQTDIDTKPSVANRADKANRKKRLPWSVGIAGVIAILLWVFSGGRFPN